MTEVETSAFGDALKLVTAGASFRSIEEEISKTVSDSNKRDSILDAVLEYFRVLSEFSPDAEFGKAYARLNLLFHNSLKIQDYKTALSVQKEINKLLKLSPSLQDDSDFLEI